jgi:methyl-accepting chemotaxis protein
MRLLQTAKGAAHTAFQHTPVTVPGEARPATTSRTAVGMTHITDGMTHITDGMTHITDGMTHITDGMTNITDGMTHITDGTPTVAESSSNI